LENEWNASSRKLELLLTWQARVPKTGTCIAFALKSDASSWNLGLHLDLSCFANMEAKSSHFSGFAAFHGWGPQKSPFPTLSQAAKRKFPCPYSKGSRYVTIFHPPKKKHSCTV